MPTRSRANNAAAGGRRIGGTATRQGPRRLPSRGLLLYIAAVLGVWLLVTLFTASSVMQVYSTPRALALNPFNASAKAQMANDIVYVTGDPRQTGAAARLSREALRGNAALPSAYRMIGLDNARREKPVKPMILAATYLTRRDYVANLWLIEDAVKRGRMDEAMTAIDTSLRTSRRGQALLFPILAKALTEADMRQQFIRVFRGNPDWMPGFLGYYVGARQPAAPLAQVMLPIRNKLPESYRPLERLLVSTMVGQQDFDAARRYERAIAPTATKADAPIIRHARFEEEGPYPPIDWHLFREAAYGSDIARGDKGNKLVVVSDEERPNLVARQLVELRPGTYRLSAEGRIVTGNDDASAIWRVGCAEQNGPGQLATVKFVRGAVPTPGEFTVPSGGCRNYWVSLSAAAGFGSAPLQAEFAQVRIQPVGS